jgi:hypothetical protein
MYEVKGIKAIRTTGVLDLDCCDSKQFKERGGVAWAAIARGEVHDSGVEKVSEKRIKILRSSADFDN